MTIPINELTEQELIFLKSQGIRPEEIFDGRGMSNPTWKDRAKQAECDFILAGRCTNGGHRLKSRSGHCIQCDTAKISFIRRENAKAYVYLAAAKNRTVIKIGYASLIYAREETLRKQGYGGYWDWEILCWVKTQYAGKIEREISYLFSEKRISGSYSKDNKIQESVEMFSCDAGTAKILFSDFTKNRLGLNTITSNNYK
jgi:hypothetical protein